VTGVDITVSLDDLFERIAPIDDRLRFCLLGEIGKKTDETVVACIFIRTSLSLGAGFGTSVNLRTSGAPYFSYTTAFIPVL
jgi:hypothetical protein